MVALTIATEDLLSEGVLEHLLRRSGRFTVAHRLRREGNGYLRRIAPGLNRAAKGHPYVMLTDLDLNECVLQLMRDMLDGQSRDHRFAVRVAVREVESWLLADIRFITQYLGISESLAPTAPDTIDDPKLELINLARRSRRSIRRDIVPREGSSAIQGRNYNAALLAFVHDGWDPVRASVRSPSLKRCLNCFDSWQP